MYIGWFRSNIVRVSNNNHSRDLNALTCVTSHSIVHVRKTTVLTLLVREIRHEAILGLRSRTTTPHHRRVAGCFRKFRCSRVTYSFTVKNGESETRARNSRTTFPRKYYPSVRIRLARVFVCEHFSRIARPICIFDSWIFR